jgi:phage baseplate assembly protein W
MAFFLDLNNVAPQVTPSIVDTVAIGQWVNDFIQTRKGERLFNLDYGLNLDNSLFDLIDTQSALILFSQVTTQLETAIPIVTVDPRNSTITPNTDTNTYALDISYIIVGVSGNRFSAKVTLGGANV